MSEALAAMAAATAAGTAATAEETAATAAAAAAATAQANAAAAVAAAAAAQATANEALAAANTAAAASGGVTLYPPTLATFTGGWLNQSGAGFSSVTEDDADGLTVTCTQVGFTAGLASSGGQAQPGASRVLKLPAPPSPYTAVIALDLATVGPALQAAGIAFLNTSLGIYNGLGFGQLAGLTQASCVIWEGAAGGYGVLQVKGGLDTVGVAGNYTPGVLCGWQCRGTGLLWLKVRDDGVNLTTSASNDGVRWVQVTQGLRSVYFSGGAPDTVGLFFACVPLVAAPAPLIAVIKSWQLIPG
jgi:hypothetical protein